MELEGWADLPEELLAIIFDCLREDTDIIRFGGVCRSWRSSVDIDFQNKHMISPLSLQSISSFSWYVNTYEGHPRGNLCCSSSRSSPPQYVIPNALYHLRSSNKAANWIVSVQESESEPGKLLLSHALTREPIPGSSGCSLDMSGWSLTRIALSHSFSPLTCDCPRCSDIAKTKIVYVDRPMPIAVFNYFGGMCALIRSCLSNDAVALHELHTPIYDFVNFNGCLYAVDARFLYVLDRTRWELVPLTCVNLPDIDPRCCKWCGRKRFVVSDGDIYLLFGFCIKGQIRHEILIYKLVMDDIINATRYEMVKVENLGDRVFVINKDCSFSVSSRCLPPPLVGNCILVSRQAFAYCKCISAFYVHYLGVKPTGMVRRLYYTLFKPPLLWTHQLQKLPQRKRKITSYNVEAEKL